VRERQSIKEEKIGISTLRFIVKGETKRLRFLMPDEIQKLFSNCTDQTDLGVDDYWSEAGIPFIPHLQI
jgi:hypothetical protein